MANVPLPRERMARLDRLTADVLLETPPRFRQVAFVDDVVALEDAACRVPEKHHCDPLRHTRAHKIPRGSAATVVQTAARDTCPTTRLWPRFDPRSSRDAVPLEDQPILGSSQRSTCPGRWSGRLWGRFLQAARKFPTETL